MTLRPLVDLDARSSAWDEPPWPSAFELARILPRNSWTLIGGLMVRLHAAMATLPAPRSTVDVDTALHLETNAVTFAAAGALLLGAGYELDLQTKHAYRFDRGLDRVDLLCSDRHAIWKRPRYGRRPLFGVPGGTRALQQTINVDVMTKTDSVRLVVPSVRGGLILKSAAYIEDPRDKGRHAEDAVVLLACLDDPVTAADGLSQRSRRRLRTMVRTLLDERSPWIAHDPTVASLARESLQILAVRLGA
ncbi:MAG: hypothetical protein JWQ19_2571 [Subtercola sp.]|nr:hypothetical protein [Subtercola sp.]